MFKTLLVLLCCAVTVAARQVDYVEFDGAKNPQDIPTWLAWDTAFRTIALAIRSEQTVVPDTLQMSKADQQLVLVAAKAHADRDTACREKVERLKPLVGTVKDEVINERQRAIQLECRQGTLDAAESLMSALSPEGQLAMDSWLEKAKAGIHVRVPKDELAHYRRPY